MRTHLVHAVEHLDQARVGMPLSDGAEHGARDAGRPVHVHAHLDEPRDDLLDLRFGGPFFHHYDHGFTASTSLARLVALTSLPCPSPFISPWTTRRSSRRASSMIRSNSRAIASGPSGPSDAMLAHVVEHVLLAIRLIDLDALLLLQPADLADAARALVEQPHEHFVHAIDVPPQIVERHGFMSRRVSRRTHALLAATRTYVLDPFDELAASRPPRR